MTEFDESSKGLPQNEEKMAGEGAAAVPPTGEPSVEAASVPLDEIVFEPIPEPADEIVFEPLPAFAEPVASAEEPAVLGEAPMRAADAQTPPAAVSGPAQAASRDDGSVAGGPEAPVASGGSANPFAALQSSATQAGSAAPSSEQPAAFEPYAVGAAMPSRQATPCQAAYGSQPQSSAPYRGVSQAQGGWAQTPPASSATFAQAPSSSGAGSAFAQAPSPSAPAYSPAPYAGSGAYGVPPQSPVPPAPAPVYGYEPSSASAGQKRRWPWFLLGLAVGLLLGLGGCASCMGVMFLAEEGYDSSYSSSSSDYDRSWDDDGLGGGRDDYYGYDDSDALGSPNAGGGIGYSYDELVQALGTQGIEKGTPSADGACAKGFYTVGRDGDIPAGLYYLEGSNDEVGRYYVFDGDEAAGQMVYEADDSVQYLGNYFAELEEGDVIAFEPAGDATMYPAPTGSFNPQSPYVNGCYRVGVDIPAGTYTVTALEVSAAAAGEESAAYVMKDLDFDDDSIVDTKYVIAGGEQTVTVTDGQYLELFAATATPAQN